MFFVSLWSYRLLSCSHGLRIFSDSNKPDRAQETRTHKFPPVSSFVIFGSVLLVQFYVTQEHALNNPSLCAHVAHSLYVVLRVCARHVEPDARTVVLGVYCLFFLTLWKTARLYE